LCVEDSLKNGRVDFVHSLPGGHDVEFLVRLRSLDDFSSHSIAFLDVFEQLGSLIRSHEPSSARKAWKQNPINPKHVGVVTGGVAALGAVSYLGSVFRLGDPDYASYVYSTAIVAVVAFAASFIPAWRATLMSPLVAIRNRL